MKTIIRETQTPALELELKEASAVLDYCLFHANDLVSGRRHPSWCREYNARNLYIIKAHFGLLTGNPRTFASLGRELGVSTETVRRVVYSSLRQIRRRPRLMQLLHQESRGLL